MPRDVIAKTDSSWDAAAPAPAALHSIDAGEFFAMTFPPREMFLSPVLPAQGLVMAYAPRGLGKTYFALSLAHAVASGGTFLRYKAPKPRRVLYVDGEMPAVVMQERMKQIAEGADMDIVERDRLRIITPDLQGDLSVDISTSAGQMLIEPHLEHADLVILDNLACLHLSGAENEGDSWLPVQGWVLSLRRRGKSVVVVHHSAKAGQQRGTSRREDILDTVIALRRPSDHEPDQGARFEVHLEKARGIHGDDALPFEAQLETRDGKASWTTRALVDVELAKVIALVSAGVPVREIAEETGMSRSKVGRLRRAAIESGALADVER